MDRSETLARLKWATAFHEAGHASMLNHFGDQIEAVYLWLILGDNQWNGLARRKAAETNPDHDVVQRLAGPLAECRFLAGFKITNQLGLELLDAISRIAYDTDDDMQRFVPDLLESLKRREVPRTTLSFRIDAQTSNCEMEMLSFESDVRDARKVAEEHGINVMAQLLKARDLLNSTSMRAAVARLAETLLDAPESDTCVQQLLEIPHVGQHVKHFESQPGRAAKLVQISGTLAHHVLDDAS